MKVRYIFIHIYIYIYIYIYIVEEYIQLYIVYDLQEPLGILLKWEHNVYLSSSKEVGVVSLGCWAEQPQLCSSSLFGECHFSYSPESESEWRARAEDGSADSLRLERPDAMVQGLEGRPLWGRAVYTALHGARLSSVPSGDQSANPASVLGHSGLQRALLSVSSAQKCSGDGRLATPSGVSRAARSAVPCRSSVPGHRASRSKYTRGQSQETGSLSKSPGGVGALAKRVLLGSAWADSGS